jgi:hypothetical protein
MAVTPVFPAATPALGAPAIGAAFPAAMLAPPTPLAPGGIGGVPGFGGVAPAPGVAALMAPTIAPPTIAPGVALPGIGFTPFLTPALMAPIT